MRILLTKKKITLKQTLIKYLSLIIFLISVFINIFDNYNLALTCLFISFYLFYYSMQNDNDWDENPLRITVLIFMILHLLFWFRCLIIIKYATDLNLNLYSYIINLEDVPQATYKYLMMTYLYFYSVYFGYHTYKVKNRNRKENYKLNQKYAIILGIVITSIASYYYLSANLEIQVPTVIRYIGSNMQRFFYLFWCLFTIILLNSKKKHYKYFAIFGFIISTLIGIVVLIQIKMRFILLMQLLCALIVYLHIKKVNFQTVIKIGIVMIAIIMMFGFISDMKFERTSDTKSLVTSIDEMIARGTNAHVETLCVSMPEKYGNFISSKKSLIVYEILGGLPFANVFFDSLNDEASLDMQVNWVHAGQRVKSSFNVPLFTSLEYGFSILLAIIVALLCGFFHGLVLKKTIYLPFQYSWVIGTSIFVRVALQGVRREDLFGIFIDILMYIIIIRIISIKANNIGN